MACTELSLHQSEAQEQSCELPGNEKINKMLKQLLQTTLNVININPEELNRTVHSSSPWEAGTSARSWAGSPWGDKITGLLCAQSCSPQQGRLGNPARDGTRENSYRPVSECCLSCAQKYQIILTEHCLPYIPSTPQNPLSEIHALLQQTSAPC